MAKGEGAAPVAEPPKVGSTTVARELPEVSIANYGTMDDDGVFKVYVALDGELEGAGADAIEVKFERNQYSEVSSLLVVIRSRGKAHRLFAEKLFGPIAPDECKWKVNKAGTKLIVTLKKADERHWEDLRTKVVLPFRRGGGGAPR